MVAVCVYQDARIAVAYLDFQLKPRDILWHAPDAHQFNYESVAAVKIRLSTMKLEIPDRIDRLISLNCLIKA